MSSDIIRYKDIVWFRALAGLKSEVRQNYLGYLWFLLEPTLNTLAFYLIFGLLQGNRGIDYIAFLLIGTTTWQWFDSGVNGSLSSIKAKVNILNSYALPMYIFPLVQILITTVKFAFAFSIVMAFCAFARAWPAWVWLWLPVIFTVQLSVIVGVALPLTLFATRVNDAVLIVSTVFRILFFLSGIFFAADKIPPHLHRWFYANPMASLIQAYRDVVLHHATPNLKHLGWAAIFGLSACALGLFLCRRVERSILKSIAQ